MTGKEDAGYKSFSFMKQKIIRFIIGKRILPHPYGLRPYACFLSYRQDEVWYPALIMEEAT